MVDGDKSVMGYMYEAMDKAEKFIHAHYENKGDEGYENWLLLWRVVDDQWKNTLLPLVTLYLYQLNSDVCLGRGVIFLFFRPRMGVLYTFSKGWLWSDPLIFSLGVLWLNGIVDYALLGFLTLGLVSRALKG